jgi:pimeloyl-ACP methyl ester carboxylesterase
MYTSFVENPRMTRIRERTVWIHVDVPGQGHNVPDLPADYVFPTMQQIGEDLVHVLDQLQIKEVVCFGEGAGANIVARFAMAHIDRVLGVCLLHATGTTAGLLGSLKEKATTWKLDHIGMNPSAESYLVLHRFGTEFSKAKDTEELKAAIENYQEMLRNKANPKNLKKFVEAFLRRTNIADSTKKLKCPILLITGQKSVFNATTRALHQAVLKSCPDKGKVEFIEVAGVANVLEEKPVKLAESFQYFLQGLGLVSSLPMHNVSRTVPPPLRVRSMSMVDYDLPACQRAAASAAIASGGKSGPPTPVMVSPVEESKNNDSVSSSGSATAVATPGGSVQGPPAAAAAAVVLSPAATAAAQ